MKRQLLSEGPVGHMAHPYENLSMSFRDLKSLFKHIIDGFPDVEITNQESESTIEASKITEKFDGQNIIITYDHDQGKALIIRRMAQHSEMGGIDKEDTRKFFTTDKIKSSYDLALKKSLNDGMPEGEAKKLATDISKGAAIEHVAAAFYDAMREFETISERLPRELFVTEQGCRIFYNGEVLDPRTRNIVDYDNQDLIIHRTKHAVLCPDSNRLQSLDDEISETYSVFLNKQIEMLAVQEEMESKIMTNPLLNFDNLVVDEEIYTKAVMGIDKLLQNSGEGATLSDRSTLKDYVDKVIDRTLASKFSSLNKNIIAMIREAVLMTIIERRNPTIKQHINPILELISSSQDQEIIKQFLRTPKAISQMIKESIKPIEYIVHNFAVDYLKAIEAMRVVADGDQKGFIKDPGVALDSLRKKVGRQVTNLQSAGSEKDISTLKTQIHKILNDPNVDIEDVLLDKNLLKIYDKISSTIEGLVFSYRGQQYKITGQFAPINQIMGLGRFSRPGKRDELHELPSPATYESVINERIETGQNIAVFSGGFKPPHVGHFLASKYLAEKSNADLLYILVGANTRYSKNKEVKIGPIESEAIWRVFYESADVPYEIEVIRLGEGDIPSPVKWVYEHVENEYFRQDRVFVGIGAKPDTGEKEPEDKRWSRLVEKYNNTRQVIIPLQGGSIRGSTMRELLANNDDSFMEFLPDHMSDKQKLKLRNNLVNKEHLK